MDGLAHGGFAHARGNSLEAFLCYQLELGCLHLQIPGTVLRCRDTEALQLPPQLRFFTRQVSPIRPPRAYCRDELPLNLTSAARESILEAFAESPVEAPAAQLGRLAPIDARSPLYTAVAQVADEPALKRLASEREWKSRLTVFVVEQSDCAPEDLVTIDGVVLTIPPALQARLESHTLDFADDKYVIKPQNGGPLSSVLLPYFG